MNSNNTGRYIVSVYYTHIKQNLITHVVKRFTTSFNTFDEALSRARRLADKNKGIYTTTLQDAETGDILYQKIEINNMSRGMIFHD